MRWNPPTRKPKSRRFYIIAVHPEGVRMYAQWRPDVGQWSIPATDPDGAMYLATRDLSLGVSKAMYWAEIPASQCKLFGQSAVEVFKRSFGLEGSGWAGVQQRITKAVYPNG